MRFLRINVVEKIKVHILCVSNLFVLKLCRSWHNVEKYCTTR